MYLNPRNYSSLEAALLWFANALPSEMTQMGRALARTALSMHGSADARKAIMTLLPAAVSSSPEENSPPAIALRILQTVDPNGHMGAVAEVPPALKEAEDKTETDYSATNRCGWENYCG